MATMAGATSQGAREGKTLVKSGTGGTLNFASSFQLRGKKTLLSLTLICYCELVDKVKIVRGNYFTWG